MATGADDGKSCHIHVCLACVLRGCCALFLVFVMCCARASLFFLMFLVLASCHRLRATTSGPSPPQRQSSVRQCLAVAPSSAATTSRLPSSNSWSCPSTALCSSPTPAVLNPICLEYDVVAASAICVLPFSRCLYSRAFCSWCVCGVRVFLAGDSSAHFVHERKFVLCEVFRKSMSAAQRLHYS